MTLLHCGMVLLSDADSSAVQILAQLVADRSAADVACLLRHVDM